MSLAQLIIGWFYYGIFYMGLSVFATAVINRAVKRYMTAPLVINAFSILSLLILFRLTQMTADQFWYYLLFVYMPIVAASFTYNLIRALIRRDNPFGLMPINEKESQKDKVGDTTQDVATLK